MHTNREEMSRSIIRWMEENKADAIAFASQLVRIESVNHPPGGNEAEYQRFLAEWMLERKAEVDQYELSDIPGLREHPAYMNTRNYDNRPNVVGRFSEVAKGAP